MRVLLPVDGSDASRKAVQFATLLCAHRGDVEVTLFHVVDLIPDFINARRAGPAYKTVADEWVESHRDAGQKLLSHYRAELLKAGVNDQGIRTALMERECLPDARRVSASLSIIQEMNSGDYQVVVLGRRGTSATNESLIGSVAEQVSRQAAGRTVCIVD